MAKANDTPVAAAGIVAIGSMILASSCCLPVLPFVAAAGAAGASALPTSARPYLLGVSVLSIGFGFYQARLVTQCKAGAGRFSLWLLWTSAAVVGISIFFPQMLANVAADLLD